jgi:hypothetical protein
MLFNPESPPPSLSRPTSTPVSPRPCSIWAIQSSFNPMAPVDPLSKPVPAYGIAPRRPVNPPSVKSVFKQKFKFQFLFIPCKFHRKCSAWQKFAILISLESLQSVEHNYVVILWCCCTKFWNVLQMAKIAYLHQIIHGKCLVHPILTNL